MRSSEIIDSCNSAIERAVKKAEFHHACYVQANEYAKVIFEKLKEVREAEDARKEFILKRWNSRKDMRLAKQLIANARPVKFPGQVEKLNEVSFGPIEEIGKSWFNASAEIQKDCVESGVYALFRNQEIVYIGQSTNVALRVLQHLETKSFTHASYISVSKRDLNSVERMLIDLFMPIFNMDLTTLRLRKINNFQKVC